MIPQYMNCCDVIVLPSLTSARWRTFGRVLPKQWRCGVPVLGSRSGNIPEMIGDGNPRARGFVGSNCDGIGRIAQEPLLRERLKTAVAVASNVVLRRNAGRAMKVLFDT